MRPNIIQGMKSKGVGRAPQTNHIKKLDKSFLKYQAQQRKKTREVAQYERHTRTNF